MLSIFDIFVQMRKYHILGIQNGILYDDCEQLLLFTKLQHNVQLILDIKLLMYDHVDNNFLCVPQALNYMSSEG